MKDNSEVGNRQEVTDPVCKMTFPVKKAVATSEYGGVTYHFCTEACQKQFAEDPVKYTRSEES